MRLSIIIFIAIWLHSINQVKAATIFLPMPEGATLANGSQVHFQYPASSTDYENNYRSSKNFQTSSGKNLPVTVEHSVKPDMPRVGGAVTKLLRAAPYVGTAIALKEIVCELSDICTDPENPDEPMLKEQSDPPTAESPAQTPFSYYSFNNNPAWPKKPTSTNFCVASSYPPNFLASNETVSFQATGTYGSCARTRPGFGTSIDTINNYTGCAPNYYQDGLVCKRNNSGTTTYRPVTGQDWDDAAPKLSVPQVIPHLVQAGEPVPVEIPQLQPKEFVSERETTTIRDENGTAVGTQERTTTVKIEPLPNPAPTSANSPAKVTETVVTTTTNITNNTTNTTTTTIDQMPDETEPPPEEEETDIEFDEVADEELETYEFDEQFEKQDWTTAASCPPDPVLSISAGSYTLPFHYACDFASQIRFIVIALAALGAGFIITGARSGTD